MAVTPKIIFAALILCCSTIEISGIAFKCPSGWKTRDVHNSVECYLFADRSFKKFTEARDFCKGQDSQLASIHSADENEWIKKNRPGSSDYWIGWIHADGKEFWGDASHEMRAGDYTNFEGSCNGRDCDHAIVNSWGKWKKVSQDYIHGPKALCKMTEHKQGGAGWVDPSKQNNKEKRPPFKCLSEWKSRDVIGNVECYYYGTVIYKKYSEARDYCKDHRSKLVSIQSEDENVWIKSNRPFGIDSYWIGYVHADGKDFWNDKNHPIGSYTHFDGISTCIKDCNSAVVDNWGKWSKVNGVDYIHGAKALCKMTEEDYHASNAGINGPVTAMVFVSIFLAQIINYF